MDFTTLYNNTINQWCDKYMKLFTTLYPDLENSALLGIFIRFRWRRAHLIRGRLDFYEDENKEIEAMIYKLYPSWNFYREIHDFMRGFDREMKELKAAHDRGYDMA